MAGFWPATGLSSGRDPGPLGDYPGGRWLSNRPTRGTFISRSVAGDGGVQSPRGDSRGLIMQARARTLGAVVCGQAAITTCACTGFPTFAAGVKATTTIRPSDQNGTGVFDAVRGQSHPGGISCRTARS